MMAHGLLSFNIEQPNLHDEVHPQMSYVFISGLSRRVVDSEYTGADFKNDTPVRTSYKA
jgi:hypothetical protein